MRLIVTTVLLISIVFQLEAQVLGTPRTFDFILSPPSARTTAMGGTNPTVRDEDNAQGIVNPALLNPEQHNHIYLSHAFDFAGIQHGAVSYAHKFDSLDYTFHAGVQYLNLGTFDLTDEFGNINGDFQGSEVGVFVGAGKQLSERIAAGVNLRWMNANYEIYQSGAIGADFGILYTDSTNTFAIGATIKNIGLVYNQFTNATENLRQDIQLGLSKRLQHLPFRLSVTMHQLQQWNTRYADPNNAVTDFLGNPVEESLWKNRFQNLMSHFIFGGEFLIGSREQVRLRFGYNHLRNQQLRVDAFRSRAGFSLGFGLNVKRFKLDYGVGIYHLAGGSHMLSLRFNPFSYQSIVGS